MPSYASESWLGGMVRSAMLERYGCDRQNGYLNKPRPLCFGGLSGLRPAGFNIV
jgi:hypothetical protein